MERPWGLCRNGLSHFMVSLQGCSLWNLLHLLKVNEAIEPMHVTSAILEH